MKNAEADAWRESPSHATDVAAAAVVALSLLRKLSILFPVNLLSSGAKRGKGERRRWQEEHEN